MGGTLTRVEGVPEAVRAYQSIADQAADMTPAHRTIVEVGVRAARAAAPRATGTLAGSIGGEAAPAEATLEVGVPYWPFVEFGTRYVKGRRFMGAGIRAALEVAPDAYRAALEDDVKRATR